MLVITWTLFFSFGFIGHLLLENSIGESLFKSLQLFHLHYHPFPGSGEEIQESVHSIPWWLEIARFGSGLWALSLFPALIGLFFEDRIKLWWVRLFRHNHYIVCGECSRSLALVGDLRHEKQKVIMIGTCLPEELNLPAGVVYLRGDSADETILNKAAVIKAKHIIALHENDRANIETLIAAARMCDKRHKSLKPVEAFAHISDIHLQSGLHHIFTTQGGLSNPGLKGNLFNYYELMARLMARKFPFPPILVEPHALPVHLIIVGFGSFGQNVALKFVKMAQQLYSVEGNNNERTWKVIKPRISIVDPEGDVSFTQFSRSYPGFTRQCDCKVFNLSTKDQEFMNLDFIKPFDSEVMTSIILCLENEAVTMSALNTLLDISRAVTSGIDHVFIRIAKPERLQGLLDKLQPLGGSPKIVYFASDLEVFNANVLLNQSLDEMAETFHKAYLEVEEKDRRANNLPPASGKNWEELSEDDRQSNREAADHTWAKLGMMGYRIEEVPVKKRIVTDNGIISELEKLLEELAKFEHYRWMVWRVLNGWQYGSPRNNEKKLHPDIVEYEFLEDSTQEKDRANIRAIITLFRNGALRTKQ
jgi:voltage-gated potassium channel Kch